jgi:hypothetical protein
LAEAVKDGWFAGLVVVPTTIPEASVTVGPLSTGAEMALEINEHRKSAFPNSEEMCNAILGMADVRKPKDCRRCKACLLTNYHDRSSLIP